MFGVWNASAFDPKMVSGVLFQSNLPPFNASYADLLFAVLDVRKMLSVVSICGRKRSQSWTGQDGSIVHRLAMVWYFADFTAGSAALTL